MTWEILLGAFRSDDPDRWLAALVMAHSKADCDRSDDPTRREVIQLCRDFAAWLGDPAWDAGRIVLIRAHRWALHGAA